MPCCAIFLSHKITERRPAEWYRQERLSVLEGWYFQPFPKQGISLLISRTGRPDRMIPPVLLSNRIGSEMIPGSGSARGRHFMQGITNPIEKRDGRTAQATDNGRAGRRPAAFAHRARDSCAVLRMQTPPGTDRAAGFSDPHTAARGSV